MALTKTLKGSIVVLDLNPDGSLRASNVERHYVLTDEGVEIARPLERDVLTAGTLAAVLPDHAVLLLRVSQLETDLAAAQALAQANGEAAAAVGDELQGVTSERNSLQVELDALRTERDALREERDALKAEKDAAAARAARSVSPLQARKALKASGMLAAVQAMVAAAPEDDDIRLAWDWALTWERDSPFIDSLGAALGLTSQQIDDLFALAATM